MTQNAELSTLKNGELPLGEAPKKKAGWTKWRTKWRTSLTRAEIKEIIRASFSLKPGGFTIPDVVSFLTESGNGPSDSYIGDLLTEMVVDGAVEKTGDCRSRFRLYRIVAAPAAPLPKPEAGDSVAKMAEPTPGALNPLTALEKVIASYDAGPMRAGLEAARDIIKLLAALTPEA